MTAYYDIVKWMLSLVIMDNRYNDRRSLLWYDCVFAYYNTLTWMLLAKNRIVRYSLLYDMIVYYDIM